MGNNLTPYSLATGEENYYLLAPKFKFFKKDKIEYDTLLGGIYVEDSDLKESFKELELYKIHSNYDMLSCEKTVNDEKQKVIDDKDEYKYTLPIFRLNYSE